MAQYRLVYLCGGSASSRAIFHRLRSEFGEFPTIVEQRMSRRSLFQRRAKRLGVVKAIGQVAFCTVILPVLKRLSRERVREISERYELCDQPIQGKNVLRVRSVNSAAARQHLVSFRPDLVVVNGTRIIGRKTLSCLDAVFINTHQGITPLYRGVYGSYWALADRRPDLVGTTIHYIDEGIDTGGVVRQVHFDVTPDDNVTTYPLLHTGTAINDLIEVASEILEGRQPATLRAKLPSKLRTHPTALQYLWNRAQSLAK